MAESGMATPRHAVVLGVWVVVRAVRAGVGRVFATRRGRRCGARVSGVVVRGGFACGGARVCEIGRAHV